MKLMLVSVALLTAAACGGGGGNRATTTDTTAQAKSLATSPVTPTGQAVSDATPLLTQSLLTLGDMPAGWTPAPNQDVTSGSDQICGTTSTNVTSTEKASVSFEKSQTGPFLVESLERLPGDDAQTFLTTVREAASSCATWTQPGSNGKDATTFHLAALSFPRYGDETFAFRISTDPTILGPAEADVVLVRYGRVLLLAGYAGIGYSGLDSSQTQNFVGQSDAKLEPALAQLR